ncbi:zinc finger protein ZAT9-like [Actinidia eriantha]|uniref:zinc finger protein ZAT9-like n=1 Tax=Actinidia eriantha TaxID=165200 RepID=UPI002582F117|nr:zinc finger protein ZAT9-like [Actinidia eriantha]
MALMVDQQQQQTTNFKHFCRICKKGFMCGRALGGHMRAHGIGNEGENMDDEDPASDWEERGNIPANNRMYALRTNPNRLKSCRVCENCGKEFLSWKSFLEHGKCSSGYDGESQPESSPELEGEERRGCQWSKRKRSMRTKVGNFTSKFLSSEEEDIAASCLVMLSTARDDLPADQPEESCASASKEEERRNPAAAFFVPPPRSLEEAKGVSKGMFECKACKKVFNSHQALGGHRASHKKVKGCFAARLDHTAPDDAGLADDDVITHEDLFFPPKPTENNNSSKRKSKVHECSICHRIFSSGQALGGHKRCHWITSNSPEPSSFAKYHHNFHDHVDQVRERPLPNLIGKADALDLNFPANNDLSGIRRDPRNPLSFEVSTEINLPSWMDHDNKSNHHYMNNLENGNNNDVFVKSDDDEADSTLKLAKLSELKDMNMSGSSSPWLRVGIGSTTGVGGDP